MGSPSENVIWDLLAKKDAEIERLKEELSNESSLRREETQRLLSEREAIRESAGHLSYDCESLVNVIRSHRIISDSKLGISNDPK